MSSNDDFFGGSVTPRQGRMAHPQDPRPVDLADHPLRSTSMPLLPLVIGVVAVCAVVAAGFFGYRAFFGPKIVMPETLLGLERANLDATVTDQVSELSDLGTFGDSDVNVQVGIYQSGTDSLAVLAGDTGSSDQQEIDQFFEGLTQSMGTGLSGGAWQPAAAGAHGGTMKCFQMATAGAGGCAWVSDETLGVVVTGPGRDFAETTRQVRDAIER